jgi:plastocyanin
MKRRAGRSTHSAMLILVGILGSLLLSGLPGQAQPETGQAQIINLSADGPQPPQTDVAVGTAVVWVSHLAHTNLVVVTVTFTEGHRVAQATTALQDYNGFVLEGHALSGRMEGNGGKVALRFLTPGTYTYSIDQHHLTGTIVVR